MGGCYERGGRGGDQPTKSAKCNESYFSTVSKASWLILLSKKIRKKSSCNFLEGLMSFLNWLIFPGSFYFSFYVLLAIATRLNKNHLNFRI